MSNNSDYSLRKENAIVFIDGGALDKLEELDCETSGKEFSSSTHILNIPKLAEHIENEFGVNVTRVRYYHALPAIRFDAPKKLKGIQRRQLQDAEERFARMDEEGAKVFLGSTVYRDYAGSHRVREDRITLDENSMPCVESEAVIVPCKHSRMQQKKVDSQMIVDMLQAHYEDKNINAFIVISGDTDLQPALDLLIDRYQFVGVICNAKHFFKDSKKNRGLAKGRWHKAPITWPMIEQNFLIDWSPSRDYSAIEAEEKHRERERQNRLRKRKSQQS